MPLGDPAVRIVPLDRPLALRAVLIPRRRGTGDPAFRIDPAGRVWMARREEAGPSLLALAHAGDRVVARAWGPGAGESLDAVPLLIGEDDDWSGLDLTSVPALGRIRAANPGLRLSAGGDLLQMLVPAILEQKVTTAQAWFAWRWLLRRYGSPLPTPGGRTLIAPPDAAGWLSVTPWDWHTAGVDDRRAQIVRRVAARAGAIARLGRDSPEDAAERLLSIPGIGPWTIAEALARSHGAPDVVSVGDFHLCRSVGTAFLGEPVDDQRMLELLRPWEGQRQRVLRLIGAAGITAERHGPRLEVPDHVRR
ncbi:hypothetical protein D9V30_01245 [Mycetocola reblochoni]|uniref:DNA-3-methyladenine glycosylase II n=2 Tax=Mycetocola reblochoni TaxID=331618 RepID=A0A1R4ISK8_9MICO|nr:hypothetical protein D9V30_01245 [Mycetocola reblochoni]SJN22901.1 hypothetical protein FM119_03355 [Mycetocola reblochoni REB411]